MFIEFLFKKQREKEVYNLGISKHSELPNKYR